jgi:transcriptional regulator with XRE-family HTH domain
MKLKTGGLDQAIARKNLSQNAFARRIGVSSGYLSQLIRGARCPSPRVRQSILDALKDAVFEDLFEEIVNDSNTG